MNIFKQEFDKAEAIKLVSKVLIGIGQPNFDDGTGIQQQAGITNIALEHKDYNEMFAGLDLQKDGIDMSDFNKTKLTFSLPKGDYVAKIDMSGFTIEYKSKEYTAEIYNHFDKKELEVVLTGDDETDTLAIQEKIQFFANEDPKHFETNDDSSYSKTVMGIGYDGAYCKDRELGWLLFGFISKSLQFLRPSESSKLLDLFMLGSYMGESKTVRFEDLEKVLRLEMEQTFKILKGNEHDSDNEVESNDMDNFLYYVEKGNIQGNVYISQNHMFLVAKNINTGVIKAWNTMRINEDWLEPAKDYTEIDEDGNEVFNVAEYLERLLDREYHVNYEYPFEIDVDGYLKSVDKLMEEFETATDSIVYDSEKGFYPEEFMSFNTLMYEISYSNALMTSEYGVSRDTLVLTDMDINSPEYYIRSQTSENQQTRSTVLWQLFMVMGNGTYWNGKTFTDNSTTFKDYAPNEGENNYSALEIKNPFSFGSSGMLFNLPEDLTDQWRKAAFETAAYLTEWCIKNHDNEKVEIYKESVAKVFETYYDQEVYEKVKAAS
jgi:hypothetical protein